jgi:hypothetical protein
MKLSNRIRDRKTIVISLTKRGIVVYRYGKPVIIDMMGVDMFDALVTRFDEVQTGFMASIMNKSILKDNK